MFPRHPELITAEIVAHQAEIRRQVAQDRLARTAQRVAPRLYALALLQRLGMYLRLTRMPAAQRASGLKGGEPTRRTTG